ncbi:hypothetical protein D1872_289930 [compost metagenome]
MRAHTHVMGCTVYFKIAVHICFVDTHFLAILIAEDFGTTASQGPQSSASQLMQHLGDT